MAATVAASMIAVAAASSFDFDSAEYRDLFQRAEASAFQHPDWLRAFYRHFASADAEPLIVVGRSTRTGELMLVVPLLRRQSGRATRIEYAFRGVTDYVCPIVRRDLISPMRAASKLQARFLDAIGGHDLLRIEPVRQEDVAIWQLLIGAAPEPMEYGAHCVQFGFPFREWRMQNLGPRRKSALDRKARRLADRGSLRLEVLSGDAIREALVDARDFRKGRFADDPLQSKAGLDFYCEVATRGQLSGLARTYGLFCADGTIGVVFGLIDGGSYRYLLLGCDYATYGKHSPGLVMLDLVMNHWAESGGRAFDFTVGDETFKAHFGCERRPMFRFLRANADSAAFRADTE